MTILSKITLVIAALIAFGVGGAILLFPVEFYTANKIVLPNSVSLLNDLRSFGGGLIAVGMLIGIGAFASSMRLTSMVTAACVYSGFGIARVLAILFDGYPDAGFVLVMIVELAVASVCLALAIKTKREPQ